MRKMIVSLTDGEKMKASKRKIISQTDQKSELSLSSNNSSSCVTYLRHHHGQTSFQNQKCSNLRKKGIPSGIEEKKKKIHENAMQSRNQQAKFSQNSLNSSKVSIQNKNSNIQIHSSTVAIDDEKLNEQNLSKSQNFKEPAKPKNNLSLSVFQELDAIVNEEDIIPIQLQRQKDIKTNERVFPKSDERNLTSNDENEKIQEKNAIIHELQDELKNMKKQYQECEQQKQMFIQNMRDLSVIMIEKKKEDEGIEEERIRFENELQDEIYELEQENEKIKDKNVKLEETIQKLKKSQENTSNIANEKLIDQNNQLHNMVQKFEKELEEKTKMIDEFHQTNSQNLQKIEEYYNQVNLLAKKNQELQTIINETKDNQTQNYKHYQDEISRFEQENKDLRNEIQKIKNDHFPEEEDQNNLKSVLLTSVRTLTNILIKKRKNEINFEEERNKNEDELIGKIETLTKENNDLKQIKLKEYSEKYDKLMEENNHLKAQSIIISDLKNDNQKLNDIIDNLNEQINRTAILKDELDKKNTIIKNYQENGLMSVSNSNDEVKHLKDQILILQEKNEKLQKDNNSLMSKIVIANQLQDDDEKYNSIIDNLNEQIFRTDELKEELRQKNEIIEKMTKDLKNLQYVFDSQKMKEINRNANHELIQNLQKPLTIEDIFSLNNEKSFQNYEGNNDYHIPSNHVHKKTFVGSQFQTEYKQLMELLDRKVEPLSDTESNIDDNDLIKIE